MRMETCLHWSIYTFEGGFLESLRMLFMLTLGDNSLINRENVMDFNIRNKTDRAILIFFIIIVVLVISGVYAEDKCPAIAKVLASLVTVAFSIFGVAIVSETYKLNRNNHRLSLFDKRYKVYAALKLLLVFVEKNGSLTEKVSSDFHEKYLEAKFLFGKDILVYLEEIECKSSELMICKGKQRILKDDREREKSLLEDLKKKSEKFDDKFVKYLAFREI